MSINETFTILVIKSFDLWLVKYVLVYYLIFCFLKYEIAQFQLVIWKVHPIHEDEIRCKTRPPSKSNIFLVIGRNGKTS